eukprot:CAMPEP_0174739712 /NCGR_PEP_ID=MMETSP1094-20130205/72076_1 /TAXON_ID=156173 /ORGANISM="Chrysochromulina brevifilum, Strain UTEX LB 985" /LENGTH=59 /DNA_ID=CAMNT_0015943301 /DNA_START=136 /DNA_END=316 /DNA_ORIENTATION=+
MQLAAVKVLIRAPTVTLQENPESKNLAEGRQAEQLEAAKCGHTGADEKNVKASAAAMHG